VAGITSRTNRVSIASNQVHYSLTSRDIEHEIMPVAAENKLGLLVWSPLAGGYLSGKYSRPGEATGRRAKFDFPPVDTDKGELILAVLREVAGELAATPAQVVLAWLLAREQITSVIIGARTPEQLAANLDAQDLLLATEQLARLDKVSEAAMPFPHWMQRFHDRDRI
jgi:aryl-alcohol dehydrogenase-like predicted oxidoreductase